MSDDGKCGHGTSCSGAGAGHGESQDELLDNQLLKERMSKIGNKIIVLSGKGGVGKSTVAVNIAVGMAMRGLRVGLLDVDIHGPSVPRLLGIENARPESDETGLKPVEYPVNGTKLRVMSIGFLIDNRDEAIIWRGPMKMTAIKQFLRDVAWGELDCLVIDSPPGTGDEPLSVCQLIEGLTGALIITTPQKLALDDVRKSITFCRRMNLRVLGVVENMSGFVCPRCGERTEIFGSGGGERLAKEMNVPFLGRIPIDPEVTVSGDLGTPYIQNYGGTATGKAFAEVIRPILRAGAIRSADNEKETKMRVAIPMADGKLATHFGHCERFAMIDFDPAAKSILGKQELEAPEHQPGLLPRWLAERGAQLIIAGGMGVSAQNLFAKNGIKVVLGASAETPESLVTAYMEGTLRTGENVCDH